MIFITALVLIFILRLRFPKGKSVAAIIENIDMKDVYWLQTFKGC